MAAVKVQEAHGGGSGTTVAVSFAADPGAGNAILVWVSDPSIAALAPTAAGGGVTFSLLASRGNGWYLALLGGFAASGGAGLKTVTVTFDNAHNHTVHIEEWSSVGSLDAASPPLATTASLATITSPTITPSASSCLVLAAFDLNTAGITYGAAGGGFTNESTAAQGTVQCQMAYLIGTGATPRTATWTQTGGPATYDVIIASFLPPASSVNAPAGAASGTGVARDPAAIGTSAPLGLQQAGSVGIRFSVGSAPNIPVTSRWDEFQGLDITGLTPPNTNAPAGFALGVGLSRGPSTLGSRNAPAGVATAIGAALQAIMSQARAGVAAGTGRVFVPASAGGPPFLGPPTPGASRALVVPAASGALGVPESYPSAAYETLIITEQFWGGDSFVMTIGGAAVGASALVNGALLWLPDEKDAIFIIETVQTDKQGASRANATLTVAGRSIDGFTAVERVVVPLDGFDYDSQTSAPAETAMKHYVRSHASTDAPVPRQIPNLVVAPDLAHGLPVSIDARFQTLGDVVLQLGLLGGLGWQTTIDPVSGTIIWDVVVPSDRSASVFLDFDFGTISMWTDIDSALDSSTLAIVAGQGDLAARDIELRYQGSEPTGYDRREVFIDARDVALGDLATLDARGDAYLAANAATRSTDATIYPNGSFQPNRDFFLGDIVLLHDLVAGVNESARVVKLVKTYDVSAAAPTIVASVGKPFPGVPPTLAAPAGGALDTVITTIGDITGQIGLALGGLSVGGANLVRNSSFESAPQGSWDVGLNWTCPYIAGGIVGLASARIQLAGQTAGDLATSAFISINPTDDYWVSFWSYLSGYSSGVARFSVREYDAAANLIATTNVDQTAAELAPTRHALHFGIDATTPGRIAWKAATASIKVVFLTPSAATMTWQVDGVQVERGKLMTAYAPAPQELIDAQIGPTQIADDAITTQKILAGQVTAGKIAGGAITADKLESQLVLASQIIAGLPAGSRLELDRSGFRAYDSGGNQLVNIPTNGTPFSFAGQVNASSLQVQGVSPLGTAEFDNVVTLGKASATTLAAGVLPPVLPPVLAAGWGTPVHLANPYTSPDSQNPSWGGYFDPAGGVSGSTPCFVAVAPAYISGVAVQQVIEWNAATGAVDRKTTLTGLTTGAGLYNGYWITRVGTSWYLANGEGAVGHDTFRVTKVLRSTGAASATAIHDYLTSYQFHYLTGLTTDGTSLFLLDDADTGVIVATWTTAPAHSATKALTGVAWTNSAPGASITSDGTLWWVTGTVDAPGLAWRCWAFTPATGAVVANRDFGLPGAPTYGATVWDGTTFRSLVGSIGGSTNTTALYTHSGWDWTTAPAKYWVGYAWYDDAGTVYETLIGPRASVTMDRRQQLVVSTPAIPVGGADDPDAVRIYLAASATPPSPGTFWLQTTDALTVRVLSDYTGYSTHDGTGLAFPGGAGATLASADGQSWRVQGNGIVHLAGTTFPANPAAEDHYYRSDLHLGFFFDGTRWLSEDLFTVQLAQISGLAATQSPVNVGPAPVTPGSDIWLEHLYTQFFINGGTALSGACSWIGTLNKETLANANTLVATVTINSGAVSNWRTDVQTINALLSGGTAYFGFSVGWTKLSTPGALFAQQYISYRIVAT